MNENLLIEKLMQFGLTRQAASIYLFLLTHNQVTGYEIAKTLGISRSNVYTSLNSLTSAGAACQISGTPLRYVAVSSDEFCSNKLRTLSEARDYISTNLPKMTAESEGYITITGDRNILDKINNIMKLTKHRVYISVPEKCFSDMKTAVLSIVERKLKLVIIADYDPGDTVPELKGLITKNIHDNNLTIPHEGILYYKTARKVSDIRLISDSAYALTGKYGEENSTCLFSGQPNFIEIFKEVLRNEILLLQYGGN